jgi:heat shock protein HslJ
MSKRPKSREETPKEGSGSAERYRTATICGRGAQSARVFEFFPMQNLQGMQACNTLASSYNIKAFSVTY